MAGQVTDDVNPYDADTPEAAEWAAIRARVIDEYIDRRRKTVGMEPDHDPDPDAHLHAALSSSGVVFGPDVSQYQGNPDWTKVRSAGCAFGIYKVSEGRTFADPSAAWNRSHIPAAGLVAGCYHFLYGSAEYYADPSLWAAQARWFVQNADPGALHMLDVEAAATSGNHLGVREWVAEYRRIMPGHALGCYSNRSLWTNRSRMPYDPAGLFDYYWHAGIADGRYTSATGTIPQQWAGTSSLSNSVSGDGYPTVKLWQITDHASVPGVSGLCDGNAWQGSVDGLRALITGGANDDMSQADVDAITRALAAQDKALRDDLPGLVQAAVHSTPVGRLTNPDRTPVTFGQILAGEYAEHPITPAQASTLVAAALTDVTGPMAATVVDGIRANFPEVDVDYTRMGQVVAQRIDEHLGSLRVTSDAPPQTSAQTPDGEG